MAKADHPPWRAPGFLAVLAAVSALGMVWPTVPSALERERSIVGVPTVVDGDTLEIRGERIRLHAIDAPEGDQVCWRTDGSAWPCGRHAALALAAKIGRATIACSGRNRDRYHRLVAVCYLRGEDLNGWMVASGWAVAYLRFGADYADRESAARAARRGLWAGAFDMPWDWRHRKF